MDAGEKISVIIPSFNSRETIEVCLRSVIATDYLPLEIIVVDDCSTDDSPEIVERLAGEHPDIVCLIRQPENGGPAKARNAGARQAQGRYYFFLDSDTEMRPDALEVFVRRIADADAVVGIYDAVPLNSGPVPLYKALLNHYFFARQGVITYEVFDSARAGIRAEVFDAVGGFDANLSFGMDYENEELGYRITERYNMLLDPAVVVRHHFPGFVSLARTYFLRVALWMEIFVARRRFESGGVTSAGTGLSSAALLLALALLAPAALPLPGVWPALAGALSALCFCVYLYGYSGFLVFVARRKPAFLVPALLLNALFTLVIAAGASFGLLNTVAGRSEVRAQSSIIGERDGPLPPP